MASRKPRSEWSPAYRARIEAAERKHPGATHAQLRGHPEERPGTLGLRAEAQVRADLRSAADPPEVIIEGDRVMVRTTDPQGQVTTRVMDRDQWQRLRPRGRQPVDVPHPKVWEYRKRRRKAA